MVKASGNVGRTTAYHRLPYLTYFSFSKYTNRSQASRAQDSFVAWGFRIYGTFTPRGAAALDSSFNRAFEYIGLATSLQQKCALNPPSSALGFQVGTRSGTQGSELRAEGKLPLQKRGRDIH